MKIKRSDNDHFLNKLKKNEIIILSFFVVFGIFYLNYSFHRHEIRAQDEAKMLAESVASLLHKEHIRSLSGTLADLDNPDYDMIKNSFISLIANHQEITQAYLLALRDDKVIILIDSESERSQIYAHPGLVYDDVDPKIKEAFMIKDTSFIGLNEDRWGEWISVFVPLFDDDTGVTVALLGVDYDASLWHDQLYQDMIPDAIILLGLFILLIFILYFWRQRDRLQTLSKKLEYDEAFYRTVIEQAPIGIAVVNDQNFIYESDYMTMTINPKFEEIMGRSGEELSKLASWADITHPDDLAEDLSKFELFKSGEIKGYAMEKRFLRPDGSYIWTHMQITHLSGVLSDDPIHLCLLADISERKKAQAYLSESERSKSLLLSHIPGMAYRCSYDNDWTMHYVSSGCLNLTGYHPDDLIDNSKLSFNDSIAGEYHSKLRNEWERILKDHLPFKYEYEIITADKQRKWVLEMGEGIYDEKDQVEALEGIIIDITDRKQLENVLKYNNEHDRWTGLYNQYYLEYLLDQELLKDDKQNKALVGINLTSIQAVTSAYGFHYVQDLIRKIAKLLNQYCNDKIILFSTYWDRFIFYIKDYQDQQELMRFGDRLSLELPQLLKSERISGGIGILEIDENEDINADMLLKKVLIAAERSLQLYGKDFDMCFYDKDMEETIMQEELILRKLTQIAAGYDEDDLILEFQPIVDLKSDSIISFEALSRLKTEQFGIVAPNVFIPLAEKSRLIIPVGDLIIAKSLSFYHSLNEHGFGNIDVSINVSIIQLLNNGFIESLLAQIERANILPYHLTIEITESVFASDFDEINRLIGRLRNHGIKIAIDDFGTGYSSLAKERELNVDYLKIDRRFIENLTISDPKNLITSDIISIAHKFGHIALAEGVETKEQKDYLYQIGCDMIQGFLISKAIDINDALKLLALEEDKMLES